jgi:hypothetical protein
VVMPEMSGPELADQLSAAWGAIEARHGVLAKTLLTGIAPAESG